MYLPPPYYVDHLIDRRDPRPPWRTELTLARRRGVAARLRRLVR